SGFVTLQPSSSDQAIDLGGPDSATTLGLTDAELGRVTAGVLQIGHSGYTGGITLSQSITTHAGYNVLDLWTAGALTEASGASLAVTSLTARATGGVRLDNANNAVANLAGTTSGGAFQFASSLDLTVTFVDGPAGIATRGGPVSVRAGSSGSARTLTV